MLQRDYRHVIVGLRYRIERLPTFLFKLREDGVFLELARLVDMEKAALPALQLDCRWRIRDG
jgi:hypothetical protein